MNKLILSNLLEETNNNILILQDAIDLDMQKGDEEEEIKIEKVPYIIDWY